MDSIRLSQINEALNYDKNMNAMVFNLEKKRTGALPRSQRDPVFASQCGDADCSQNSNRSTAGAVGQQASQSLAHDSPWRQN